MTLKGHEHKTCPFFSAQKKAAPEHLAPIQPYCKAGMRLFCRSHYDFDEVALFQDALENGFDVLCIDFREGSLVKGIEVLSIIVVPVLDVAEPVTVADPGFRYLLLEVLDNH